MTFTSDERSEVAKRMREYDVAEFKESAIAPFLDCLGHGYTNWRGILDELADLINPTCSDTESRDSKSFTCSACGFSESKLVVSPFTLSFLSCKPSYCYCPKCGARVVEKEEDE